MKFIEGQSVLIRNTRTIAATVEKVYSFDDKVPLEKQTYLVRIKEQTLHVYHDEIVSSDVPDESIEKYSAVWNAQFETFLNAGQYLLKTPMDVNALKNMIEAGSKIGIIVNWDDSAK